MWWRSGFGVPWFSLHDILGGEVFEMKRNAFENLGALQTNTNKISEQDIFCEVYVLLSCELKSFMAYGTVFVSPGHPPCGWEGLDKDDISMYSTSLIPPPMFQGPSKMFDAHSWERTNVPWKDDGTGRLIILPFLFWHGPFPDDFVHVCFKDTLLGTNISREKSILKMIFLFPRWDMLIPWRVFAHRFWFFVGPIFGKPPDDGDRRRVHGRWGKLQWWVNASVPVIQNIQRNLHIYLIGCLRWFFTDSTMVNQHGKTPFGVHFFSQPPSANQSFMVGFVSFGGGVFWFTRGSLGQIPSGWYSSMCTNFSCWGEV